MPACKRIPSSMVYKLVTPSSLIASSSVRGAGTHRMGPRICGIAIGCADLLWTFRGGIGSRNNYLYLHRAVR